MPSPGRATIVLFAIVNQIIRLVSEPANIRRQGILQLTLIEKMVGFGIFE